MIGIYRIRWTRRERSRVSISTSQTNSICSGK